MKQHGNIEAYRIDATRLDDKWLWVTPELGSPTGYLSLLHENWPHASEVVHAAQNRRIDFAALVHWDPDVEEIVEVDLLPDEESQADHDADTPELPTMRTPATAK